MNVFNWSGTPDAWWENLRVMVLVLGVFLLLAGGTRVFEHVEGFIVRRAQRRETKRWIKASERIEADLEGREQ